MSPSGCMTTSTRRADRSIRKPPTRAFPGVRHAWTFDDMFSAYAVQGLEGKTKGAYTREELAPLAQTNVESLKEYAYFTFARADGKKERFNEPVDYYLD